MTNYEEGEILRDKQRDVRVEVLEQNGKSVKVVELEGEHKGKTGELGAGHLQENYVAAIKPEGYNMNGENYAENKATKSWVNYGDVNPRPHGGRFLKWDTAGGYWHLIISTNLEDVQPGMIQNGEKYMFEHYYIYPQDVWEDGVPQKGWSFEMNQVIDAFQEDYNPTDMDDVEYLIPDLSFRMRPSGSEDYASNYWEYLGDYGISTKTRGVS